MIPSLIYIVHHKSCSKWPLPWLHVIPTNHPVFCLISSKIGTHSSQKSPNPSFLWQSGPYNMLVHPGEAISIFEQNCPKSSTFYANFKQKIICRLAGMTCMDTRVDKREEECDELAVTTCIMCEWCHQLWVFCTISDPWILVMVQLDPIMSLAYTCITPLDENILGKHWWCHSCAMLLDIYCGCSTLLSLLPFIYSWWIWYYVRLFKKFLSASDHV